MSLPTAAVCFIVCHAGPSNHFATFAQELPRRNTHVEVYASGPALKAFLDRDIPHNSFNIEDGDKKAQEIALAILRSGCNPIVITDIGHPFAVKMQTALKEHKITSLAYYDNQEPYVPGGYSDFAARAIGVTGGVLFANKRLAEGKIYESPGKEISMTNLQRTGVGYYPTQEADIIARKRIEKQTDLREKLFPGQDFNEKKIIAYFGGNNDAYFGTKEREGAFPAFLRLLSESIESTNLSNLFISIQQHPGAKPKKIEDQLVEDWKKRYSQNKNAPQIVISHLGSDEAQVIADAAAYYQTSMNFVLAGIDNTFQVGDEKFEDGLVKMGFPSVTTASHLIEVIQDLGNPKPSQREAVLQNLGTDPNWATILENVIKENVS